MVDWKPEGLPGLKLVEFNTVATGMSTSTARVNQMQTYIATKYERDLKFEYDNGGKGDHFIKDDPAFAGNFFLQPSESQIDKLILHFAKAVKIYRETVA